MKKILFIILFSFLFNGKVNSKENVVVLDCVNNFPDQIELQIFLKEKHLTNGYDFFKIVKLDQTYLKAQSFDKEYVIDRFTGYMVEYSLQGKQQRVKNSKKEWQCSKIERMF